jgi:hypothetical protein
MTASKSDLSVQYIHNVYSMDKAKVAAATNKPKPAAAKVAASTAKSKASTATKPGTKPAKSDA